MKRVYIHIGFPKTGSTAIQKSLVANLEELEKAGLHYVNYGRGQFIQNKAIWDMARSTRGPNPRYHSPNPRFGTIDEVAVKIGEGLRMEIESSEKQIFIISSEYLKRLSERDYSVVIDQMQRHLAGFQVKIIVFMRDFIPHLKSSFSEAIKTGIFDRNNILDYFENRYRFDYFNILEKWTRVFGHENMIVRKFDKETRIKGIESVFYDIIGIKADFLTSNPENVKVAPRFLDFYFQFNKMVDAAQPANEKYIDEMVELFSSISRVDSGDFRIIDNLGGLKKDKVEEINGQLSAFNQEYGVNLDLLPYPAESPLESDVTANLNLNQLGLLIAFTYYKESINNRKLNKKLDQKINDLERRLADMEKEIKVDIIGNIKQWSILYQLAKFRKKILNLFLGRK